MVYLLRLMRVLFHLHGGKQNVACDTTKKGKWTCCWFEDVEGPGNPHSPGRENYCQECTELPNGNLDCEQKELQFMTTPPTADEGVLPGKGGVLEEPEQPLFGGGANVPPSGGIEQPPTTTTTPPRLPGGGANVPTEGGSTEQPPTGPTVAPEDNQDDGGGRPPLKSDESLPFSEGGGEAEQPSDDGQNPTIIE